MKGVAFIGGSAPPPAVCAELCRGAALIAAADCGLIAAEAAGITPDWIAGDMDSIENEELLLKYPKDRVLRYSREKDLTDTEIVCELLFDKGCGEVILAGGGGGRLAHTAALLSLFEREKAPSRWRTPGEDIFLLKDRLELAVPAGTIVSVFPLGRGNWAASSKNLKWPLDGLCWKRGFFGISNVATSGSFEVKALEGRFLLIIDVDAIDYPLSGKSKKNR